MCYIFLHLFFVITETNTFRKGKAVLVMSESASFFFQKRHFCRMAFFQPCTPGRGLELTKG